MKGTFERDLLIHAGMGLLCALQPQLVFVWVGYILLIEGTVKVFLSRNIHGQAHLAASYMAAMEMIVRMSRIGLPHELTKYAVIFILLNGLMAERVHRRKPYPIILYFLLQLPSVLLLIDAEGLEMARQMVSFNLSGPLCLTVATFYFFRRPISIVMLGKIFQRLLLPVTATSVWLFIRTPRIAEIEFSYGANFAASGYGPNQMASMLGAGLLVIALAHLFRIPVSRWKWPSALLFGIFAIRALLTFSRGGLMGPLLVLILLVIYFSISFPNFRRQFGNLAISVLLIGGVLYGAYTYVNQQTQGALFNRYAGISHGQKVSAERYASGRLNILLIDTQIFLDNLVFGIGPGTGVKTRYEYGYGKRVAAHVEPSRLLAEHGVFGLMALLILLGFPLNEFLSRQGISQRFMLMAGVLFCLTFMLHSATRIALPMFLYGLGFSWIITSKINQVTDLQRRQPMLAPAL